MSPPKKHLTKGKKFNKKGKSPKKVDTPSRDPNGYKNFIDRLKQKYTIIYPTPRKFGDTPISISENRYGMQITYSINIPANKILMNQIKKFPSHFSAPRKMHEIEDLVRKATYYGNLHQYEITSKEDYVANEEDVTSYELVQTDSISDFYSYIQETVIGPKKFMIGTITIPEDVKKFYTEQLSVILRKIEYYKSISDISESGYREKIEKLENKIQFKKKKFGLELIEKLKLGQKFYVPLYDFTYVKRKNGIYPIHKYGSILFNVEELSAIIPDTVIRVSGTQKAEYTLSSITDEYFIQKVLYYVYRSQMEKFYGKYKRCFPVKSNPSEKFVDDIYLPYKHSQFINDDLSGHREKREEEMKWAQLRKEYASREIPKEIYDSDAFQKMYLSKTKEYEHVSTMQVPAYENSHTSEEKKEDDVITLSERFQEYRTYFKSEENISIIRSIFQAELKKAIEENPRLKYMGPNNIEPDQRIIELFPSYMHQKRYITMKDYFLDEKGDAHEKEGYIISLFSISRKGTKTYVLTPEKPYTRSFSAPSHEDIENVSKTLTDKEKQLFFIPIQKIEQRSNNVIPAFPPNKSSSLINDVDNAVGYWIKNIPYIYYRMGPNKEYRVYLTNNKKIIDFLQKIHQNYPEMQNFMYYTTQNEDIFDFIAKSYSIDYEIRVNGETIPLPSLSISTENIYCFALSKKKKAFSLSEIKIVGTRKKKLFPDYEYFCEPPFKEIVYIVDYNLLIRYLSFKNIVLSNGIIKIDNLENIHFSKDLFTIFNPIIVGILPLLKENTMKIFSQEKEIILLSPPDEDFFFKIKKGEDIFMEDVFVDTENRNLVIKPVYVFWDEGFSVCLIMMDFFSKEYFIIGEEDGISSRFLAKWKKLDIFENCFPVKNFSFGKGTVLFLFWVLHFIYLNSAKEIKSIYKIFTAYVEKHDMNPIFYLLAYFLDYSKILKDTFSIN